MRLLSLLVFAAVTLLAVRAWCARATVSLSTLVRFLALGMLLGPLAVVPVYRLIDPYQLLSQSPETQLLAATFTLGILLAPVCVFLVSHRVRVSLSVVDAFVLAFAVGLGFDLLGWLLQAGAGAENPVASLTWVPPATRALGGEASWVVASTGYQVALVALVASAVRRFRLRPWLGWALGLSAFVVAAAARAVPWWPAADIGWASWARDVLATGTLDGSLLAWGALVLAAGLQWREFRWLDVPDAAPRVRFLTEWKHLLRSLLDRDIRRFRRLSDAYGLRRQWEIARTERHRNPSDSVAERMAPRLGRWAHSAFDVLDEPAGGEPPRLSRTESRSRPFLTDWLRAHPSMVAALAWVAFFGILFLPGALETLLAFLLAALLVWWYVTGPEGAPSRPPPDRRLRLRSESWILVGGLVAAAVSVLGATPTMLVPGGGATPPEEPRLVLLFLATAACALALPTRRVWRMRAGADRKPVALRRGFSAAKVGVLVWVTVWVYTRGLSVLHEKYGDVFFYMSNRAADRPPDFELPFWASILTFEQPPPFGNQIPAWIMAVVAGVVALAAGLVLQAVSRQLEATYIGDEPGGDEAPYSESEAR